MTWDNLRVPSLLAALRDRSRQQGTAGLVEASIVAISAAFRVGVLIQIIIASYGIWTRSAGSVTLASITLLVIGWSISFFITVIRHGSFADVSIWWGIVDVIVAALALIVSSSVLPPEWWIGTWLIWAPGYAGPVAGIIPGWFKSTARAIAISASLAVVYAFSAFPGNTNQPIAIFNNALSYVIFTVAAVVFAHFARRLAAVADENQARAAHLAAELELANYRFHVHNATGLLSLLARDDLPPELAPSLREQAARESNRLRNEVLDAHRGSAIVTAAAADIVPLDTVITAALGGFSHLPLERRTALAQGVGLTRDGAAALETALVSLLYNVQFHAQASEVVIHADAGPTWWEVSVADDGCGFDPETVPLGFGLAEQVLDSATRKGWQTKIDSHIGEGTRVIISGPRADG